MAATSKKNRTKRRRGQRQPTGQSTGRLLNIGVGILIVILLGYGTFQVLGYNQTGGSSPVVQADSGALESQNIADNQGQQAAEAAPVTDRETRFLGPPSDPATLSLAEAGKLEQPTLLWFHADWCHVCQRVKPDVVNLGEQYDGKVKIVRLNVDHAESREALRRYGVRATPTFVLFDQQGQIRGNVPGWPGYQAFTDAFDQLLAGS